MENFKVDFYKKEDGSCPVQDFLDSLEHKMRVKLLRMIMLLEENGNELREPYSKYLDEGIFEIRVKQGTSVVRVLYFFVAGKRIILTHGFMKKTQKTPRAERELAEKYRNDYLNREEQR